MYQGIAHMAFVVSDLEQSLRFYRDTLGFEVIHTLNDDGGNPWLTYLRVKNGQYIEIFNGGTRRVERPVSAAGFSHMCLEVDDIYAIEAHLIKHGVTIDIAPKQGRDRNMQCWAKDPDGNRIEFMQIDSSSPQANC